MKGKKVKSRPASKTFFFVYFYPKKTSALRKRLKFIYSSVNLFGIFFLMKKVIDLVSNDIRQRYPEILEVISLDLLPLILFHQVTFFEKIVQRVSLPRPFFERRGRVWVGYIHVSYFFIRLIFHNSWLTRVWLPPVSSGGRVLSQFINCVVSIFCCCCFFILFSA